MHSIYRSATRVSAFYRIYRGLSNSLHMRRRGRSSFSTCFRSCGIFQMAHFFVISVTSALCVHFSSRCSIVSSCCRHFMHSDVSDFCIVCKCLFVPHMPSLNRFILQFWRLVPFMNSFSLFIHSRF